MDHMASCPQCGFDLRGAPAVAGGGGELSRQLWQGYLQRTSLQGFAPDCAFGDYLDGVYVLVQLFLRRHSRRLLAELPYPDPLADSASGDVQPTVESCSIAIRRALIMRAAWLLEEWPSRFLDHMQRARLTRTHFLMTALAVPPWLAQVVEQELTAARRSTSADVESAMAKIADRGEGVTKSAVRRELGVAESRAADLVLSRREHARLGELLTICGKFEKAIATTPQSRDQYASLVRDYAIFLLSVLRQENVDAICLLDQATVYASILQASEDGAPEIDRLIRQRAMEMNEEYATTIRPAWALSGERDEAWFISRFGEPFEGHTLRERVAKMMRSGFPEDLWRSSDVFVWVLGEPKLGRRASRLFPTEDAFAFHFNEE